MLRGIHPLLSPDLLHTLAAMGHGDRIAVVDANFPALSHAKRLIVLPGVTAPAVLEAGTCQCCRSTISNPIPYR